MLSSLSSLPEKVAVPAYDRAVLSPGLLHIGVGNFHRAHQAVYLNALFNLGLDHDRAIVGAGIMRFDADRRSELEAQGWLSKVVEMGSGGPTTSVTGAMIDFCPIDAHAIIEGGCFIDATTGDLDVTNPDIVHDAQDPMAPWTVFGILLAGLALRRSRRHPPPAILSCDNIPENGDVTRRALMGLAALSSEDLCHWVPREVAFPNSMVGRITPATSQGKRALADVFGTLGETKHFASRFARHIEALWSRDPRSVLRGYLKQKAA